MKAKKKTGWALYFDGRKTIITKEPERYTELKGVVIPIDSNVAAIALELILERQEET